MNKPLKKDRDFNKLIDSLKYLMYFDHEQYQKIYIQILGSVEWNNDKNLKTIDKIQKSP